MRSLWRGQTASLFINCQDHRHNECCQEGINTARLMKERSKDKGFPSTLITTHVLPVIWLRQGLFDVPSYTTVLQHQQITHMFRANKKEKLKLCIQYVESISYLKRINLTLHVELSLLSPQSMSISVNSHSWLSVLIGQLLPWFTLNTLIKPHLKRLSVQEKLKASWWT